MSDMGANNWAQAQAWDIWIDGHLAETIDDLDKWLRRYNRRLWEFFLTPAAAAMPPEMKEQARALGYAGP